jgi:hypothetical protein
MKSLTVVHALICRNRRGTRPEKKAQGAGETPMAAYNGLVTFEDEYGSELCTGHASLWRVSDRIRGIVQKRNGKECFEQEFLNRTAVLVVRFPNGRTCRASLTGHSSLSVIQLIGRFEGDAAAPF